MKIGKVIFWLHLIAGIVAGVVILVMSATGTVLAFEKELVAWMERDVRRVVLPPNAERLPLDEQLAKVRAAHPEMRPSGITVYSDPTIATLVSIGRTNGFHVNPYTGSVQPQGAKRTRAFMQTMVEWHRFLGRHEKQRPIGKAVTGASNVAFCFLAVSGLYLWWPRQWTRSALRAVSLFNWKLSGKARDWNWHNVVGLWSAPVLIVLTLTAMPISYRWATDVIYSATRSQPPAPGGVPVIELPAAATDVKPLSQDTLLGLAQKEIPQWNQITVRLGGPRGPQPAVFAVKQGSGAPRFATAQLTLNPFTGEVVRAEKYSDYNLGRRVRSWSRFLHTGEALGPAGQFIAALASLGGVVLVYTGFALAWRRFFHRKDFKRSVVAQAPEAASSHR